MRKKYKTYLYYAILSICVILLYFYTKPQMEGYESPELQYNIESKIKVFTYATEMKPTLRMLLGSLKTHHYSYEVVGYGESWKGFRNRVNTYLSAVKRHKEIHGGQAVIVIVDGYDCLCIKDSEKVYESFITKKRSIPVMFGAESVCFNNCNRGVLKWYDFYNMYGGEREIIKTYTDIGNGGVKTKESVFLNGGMLIGTCGAVEELYTGMMELNIEDDQICAGTYLINNMESVDLDTEEAIFRNKLLERRVVLDDEDGITGPGFIHFPGAGDKTIFSDLLERYSLYLE